ncbi:MAG: helix-turn-helix transcriptional regulator [Gaiellaceae bacterium]
MDIQSTLRRAREDAGLSQAALARRARTSQATVSAYESGRKQPSVDTLSRLLAATGRRLTAEATLPREPTPEEHSRAARVLAEVLELAEALPSRKRGALRYPRLA